MNSVNVKRKEERKRRKRKNEGINRRKETLIKKAYELGEYDGIDVLLSDLLFTMIYQLCTCMADGLSFPFTSLSYQ
jgi:hypothetical protein